MSSSLQLQEPLVPPINFAMACPGVYRSGYPTKKNYPFLRALRLRSILYLCPEDYAESNLKFCEENGINVLRFPTEGNKEPFMDISERLMHRIMSALVDVRNLPLLIHCNKGKHRTGTVVAALRLLQGWSLVSIFEEYKRFAGDKARVSDQTYVELYYPIIRITPPYVASWLTVTPRVRVVYSEKELLEEESSQLGHSLLAPVNPHADAVHVANVAAAIAAKTAGGVGRHKDVNATATGPGAASAMDASSPATATAASANAGAVPSGVTTPPLPPRTPGPSASPGQSNSQGASLSSPPPMNTTVSPRKMPPATTTGGSGIVPTSSATAGTKPVAVPDSGAVATPAPVPVVSTSTADNDVREVSSGSVSAVAAPSPSPPAPAAAAAVVTAAAGVADGPRDEEKVAKKNYSRAASGTAAAGATPSTSTAGTTRVSPSTTITTTTTGAGSKPSTSNIRPSTKKAKK